MSLTRREVVGLGLAGLAGIAAPMAGRRLSGADSPPDNTRVIDTHTHFYDPTRKQGVPWPSKEDAILYRAMLPPEFQKLTEPLGVTGTIVVEASPWLEDNQWLLELAADNPFLLGIVGNLSPGTDLFHRHLSRFAKNPRFRGIRISSMAVKQGLEQPAFITDLQRMIDADLELDVNGGPETVPLVDRLARELPRLRIVINHLSNLRIDGEAPPAEWSNGLKATAKRPNVFLKVSGLIENGRAEGMKASTDTQYYQPILKVAWESFGEDRLIYGSDWPVSEIAGPYSLVLKIVSDFFGDLGNEAKEKFFARNAQVAYALPGRN